MPQMAPYNWFILFVLFNLINFIIFSISYYMINLPPNFTSKSNIFIKFNLMW